VAEILFIDSGLSNTLFIETLIDNMELQGRTEVVKFSVEGGIVSHIGDDTKAVIFTHIGEKSTAERAKELYPDKKVIMLTGCLPGTFPPDRHEVIYIYKGEASERLREELLA